MRTLLLWLLLIVPISETALDVLSEVTGIHITNGTWDFQPDPSNVIIEAQGTKDGKNFDVYCQWSDGAPKTIWLKEVPKICSMI